MPSKPGEGDPDFRVLAPRASEIAHSERRCWVCGDPLGRWKAFVVGPMCAVNRTSAEPPSHVDCARWSAVACPFLSRPHMDRREAGLPEDTKEPDGIFLRRNPGVALVWITVAYHVRPVPGGGSLFHIGQAESVEWYAEGREATREEADASIASGLPALRDLAEAQGPRAVRALDTQVEKARELLPA